MYRLSNVCYSMPKGLYKRFLLLRFSSTNVVLCKLSEKGHKGGIHEYFKVYVEICLCTLCIKGHVMLL